MGNSRIDDLRRRLEREPGSRLFAQLAEELRRDGTLADAIRVCREGLQKHPSYWSARLTLGRCLADSGDRRSAVEELRSVLQASPDNLLAGRLLAECQAALEEFAGAAETYALLVALAPGDKQLKERLAQAQERAASAGSRAHPASAEMQDRFAPIPLVAVDEEAFELERSVEAASFARSAQPAAPPAELAAPPAPLRSGPQEIVFEFEAGADTASFDPVFRPLDAPESGAAASPTTVPGVMLSDVAGPALASPTLAELYQEQGAADRAIATYRQVLEREPENAKARERLAELEAARAAGPTSRRAVIERTIARLEAFGTALQGGRS